MVPSDLSNYTGSGKEGSNRSNTFSTTRTMITVTCDGFLTPMATSCYARVKNKNGTNPDAVDDDFFLTIACLCSQHHQPIRPSADLTKTKSNRLGRV